MLERTPEGLRARFFVKQDHQGPDGTAHPGVLAAALAEALLLSRGALPETIAIRVPGTAPVGTFVEVEADGPAARARGDDGALVAVLEPVRGG